MAQPATTIEMGDEDLLTLTQAVELAGPIFRYDYDSGDGWQHWIEVEAVRSSPAATPTPICVEGGRVHRRTVAARAATRS